MDANVWIVHRVSDGVQTYVSAEWLSAHSPVDTVAPAVPVGPTAVAVPVPDSVINDDPVEDEDRPIPRQRRQPRPVCPACDEQYTGNLGVQHACEAVRAVRCKACHAFNPAHLETPPRPPYLCSACVSRGVTICRQCARPQAARGSYHDVCDECNPLPDDNVWASLGNKAKGDEMTILTRSHRPYAVEIEGFRMPASAIVTARSLDEGWVKTGDCSIRADAGAAEDAEFRSPPLKGDEGLRILHKNAKLLRDMGWRANKSCGLHVHVDMISSSEEDRVALFKFATWIQDDVYKLVAKSRSTVRYCAKLQGGYNQEERYRWLNMKHAFERHGTVEFRLHHGTTQPDRIVEWVKVCLSIVESGLKLGRMAARPQGSIFSLIGLNAYQRDYWMDVARSLHGEAATFRGE
jgi:hypothetical protein